MKIAKNLFISLFFLSFITCKSQEKTNYWTAADSKKGKITLHQNSKRVNFPKEFKLFKLDLNTLKNKLFTIVDNKNSTEIIIPNTKGEFEKFEITETSSFSPELQAKFPNIRSFGGKGVSDKFATIKLSYSPNGVQASIFRADKESEFIDIYSKDGTIYAVTNKSNKDPNWKCDTPAPTDKVNNRR
ncbi:MAG: hypothetical protein QM535_00800 [Limnohabitans sp.]|nr:hypothetical protein [Limnohabitans sp.]